MSNLCFRESILLNLRHAASAEGFTSLWLAWFEDAAMGNGSGRADPKRHLQDMMGESDEHKTKISTDITTLTELTTFEQIHLLFINYLGYNKLWVVIDDDEEGPLVQAFARRLLNRITQPDFRRRVYKGDGPEVLYFLLFALETVDVACSKLAGNMSNILAIHSGKPGNVNVLSLNHTCEFADSCVAQLDIYASGGDVPKTQAFNTSSFKFNQEAQKMKKVAASLGMGKRKFPTPYIAPHTIF